MKKHITGFLAFAALLFAPALASATTDSLTVADGTSTSSYIPIYGYYVDAAQHNQIVYPADSLSAMAGQNITGLTFYMSQTASESWNTTVTISLGIVEQSDASTLNTTAELTQVWQGLVTGMDAVLDIAFDEGFAYSEGNLLVDIQTTTGSWKQTAFYGVELANGSYLTYNYNSTSQNFMPKTKFTYSDQPVCRKPKNLVFSDVANDGFTVSWTSNPSDNFQNYSLWIDGVEAYTGTDTFYTASGLDANTTYAVEVRTVCGEGDTSGSLAGSFRTLCELGNCEVQVSGASSYYGYAEVYQNGGLLASVGSSTAVEICNGDSLVVLFHEGAYGSSNTITVTDVAGIELASFNSSGHSTGDTILAVANGCPSCLPVSSVSISNVEANTAHISWVDNNVDGLGDYAVYVGGELVSIVSGDSVYDLSDLSASTTLTVGVSRICDEGDTSGARTVTFRTACGAVTLPYFENFDGLGFNASNGLPVPCWIAYYTCTTGGRTFPCGSADGSNPTMAFTADPGMTIFIATDTIPVSGDSVFVSFRAQPNGNVDFWCGVMSDPYDSTTFIPIGNGIHTTNANNTWGEYLFSTVGFSPDTSYRVAFKYRGTGYTGNWVNVDDIEIRVFDGCIRPMDLAATEVTTESAVLDWQVNGSEDSWLLAVNGDTSVITEKPYTLTGLEPNSVYNVSLAALCQTGDTTDAIATTFRTPCPADTCIVTVAATGYYLSEYELVQNGYSFGLTSEPATYQVCSGQELYLHTAAASGYGMSIVNAAGIELFNAMPDSLTADTLNLGQPCPTCMPAIDLTVGSITSDGGLFNWQSMGSADNVTLWHIYVDGAEVGTSDSTGYMLSGLTANTVYTVGVRADCDENDTSVIRTTEFRTACEGGNCTFSVVMSDSFGDGWNGNAVDVYSAGSLFASATIVSGNSNTETFSPCLGDSVVLVWQSGQYASETSFSIVDAADSTLLSVGGSQCATGDTLVVFDGQCAATVVFVPDTTQPGPQPGGCDAPQALNATPAETTIDITYVSSVYDYEVGIVEGSVWDEASADIDQTSNNLYQFSGLTAGTEYTVAVRAVCDDGWDYIYSDWATATVSTTGGSTPQPAECLAPTDVHTVSVDSNRAVITWTAGGDETAWQIKVNDDGQNLIDASTTTYVMSNLTPATQYRVRVRAVCSAESTSDWSAELSFTTASGNDGIDAADGIACSLSPNPASSVVTVAAGSEAAVTIVDQSGREVYRSANAAATHRVDVSSLAKGAYFVRIVTVNGSAVRKLIVK